MRNERRLSRTSLRFAIALIPWIVASGCSETERTAGDADAMEPILRASASESLAAWEEIVTVLQHPRCLNCHQVESPLQGDDAHAHVPHVVRGVGDRGVSAMRCGNCHNEMGNNPTSGTPGAPHWALAPLAMNWQGLSSGELCAMLKDESRNGKRSGAALVKHMADDKLVAWGWEPGAGRAPAPIPHFEFVDLMKVWVGGGNACPSI